MLNKILYFFIFIPFGLHAIEGNISVSIVEKEKHFISEELIINVDIKSTAFSIKDVKIGFENTSEYIVVAPKSASLLRTIEVNGTDWQIVNYEYRLYPLRAGKIKLPETTISFSASMGYGQPVKDFTFNSAPLVFNVEVPMGVDADTFVLSTANYSVKSTISLKMKEGNATQIKIGDAITLSIIQKAKNVPDILLKPSTFKDNTYFKIYTEEPQLEIKDKFSTRTDTYTFVASKEGNVTIPSQEFAWWNPKEEVLHKEMTKAYVFEILPSLEFICNTYYGADENSSKLWRYIFVASLLFLLLFYKMYPHYKRWSSKRQLGYDNSEEGRYKKLFKSPDNTTLYKNFYFWLESIAPEVAKDGFRCVTALQPSFYDSLVGFEEVLADNEKEFDKILFMKEVKKLRESLRIKKHQRQLPRTINP